MCFQILILVCAKIFPTFATSILITNDMNNILFLAGLLLLLVGFVLAVRLFGAWMLRITDILDNQCRIIEQNEIKQELLTKIATELEKLNEKQ